jgi:copper oxidase (laccase) domain-containing protein
MIQRAHNDLNYLSFESIDDGRVRHGVFTRHGGVSEGPYASLNLSRSTGDGAEPVRENRRRMFEALGTTPERSLTSWLVHGNSVRVLDETLLAHKPDSDDAHADAMITRARGLALTLRFADCVPVVFYDPARAAIGIAHAGWLGIENGVLRATVQAMTADEEQAGLLRLAAGAAVLIASDVTYLADRTPVLMTHNCYRGDAYRFEADLFRPA